MQRDLIGYGMTPPNGTWPNGAKVAINFVINYEEGAERTPVNGDACAESYGGEFPLAPKPEHMRSLSMESLFEYGSRAGIWRLLRLFDNAHIPLTFFATGLALTKNTALCEYLRQNTHEIAGHGWRWMDYAVFDKNEEKKHILRCIHEIEQATGQRIAGWYTGRTSEHTRRLLREIGGFLYDSDSYADDLPYYEQQHLIIPYNLVCNDFRFCTSPGFTTAHDFYRQLKNTLDYLMHENRQALMTIGLHPRISGHPGRCVALHKFIHYLSQCPNIWITKRIDIAHHWRTTHPSP